MHRAFQAFEQIDRHQRLNAFFASRLFEVAVPNVLVGIVKLFVFREATRLHVAERRIHRQREPGQPLEDLVEADDILALRELAMKRERLQPLWKGANVFGVVVGLDVPPRARNRHAVEHLKKVEVERVENRRRSALCSRED